MLARSMMDKADEITKAINGANKGNEIARKPVALPTMIKTSPAPLPPGALRSIPPNSNGYDPIKVLVADGDFVPNAYQQRIIDALAWLEFARISPASKSAVAIVAKGSHLSSTFTGHISKLLEQKLITNPSGGQIQLTDDGRRLAVFEQGEMLASEKLHEALYRKLDGYKGDLLRVIIDVYPEAINKTDLATRAGKSETSSTFTGNISDLLDFGFIEQAGPKLVKASDILFVK